MGDADAFGAAPAQVLLRWLTQRNITVMPKATRNDLLQENLRSDDFQLTDEDFEQIATLNINRRVSNVITGKQLALTSF